MPSRLPILAFLATLTLACFSGPEVEEDHYYDGLHYFELDDQRYKVHLTREIHREMKAWSIDSTTPPPISPQQAYKLAKDKLDTLKKPKGGVLGLEKVSLTPTTKSKFVWEVSFGWVGSGSGLWPTIDLLVTMDGKVIAPVVSEN